MVDLLGWPHTLQTNKDKLFNEYFAHFCGSNNIANPSISPSITDRGVAQTVIRSTKPLLLKCKLEDEDYQTVLANMREAATESGLSARQILMGVGQRTIQPDRSKEKENMDEDKKTKKQEASQDDLEAGDQVLVKHQITGRWNKEAEIIEHMSSEMALDKS